MKHDKELILGGAQLGGSYGITNASFSEKEAIKVIRHSINNGITTFDTAPSYNRSEYILGKAINSYGYSCKSKINIITKTPINIMHFHSVSDIHFYLRKSLDRSLEFLMTDSLYAILVHHIEDLKFSYGKHLWEFLKKMQISGKVKKIGFSLYDISQDFKIIEELKPDIIQVPINILNIDFLKEELIYIKNCIGCEIHARSIFLQGVLLQDVSWFTGFFQPMRDWMNEIHLFCKKNSIEKYNLMLHIVKMASFVDAIVVGISDTHQLFHLLEVWEKQILVSHNIENELPKYNGPRELIDPRMWRKL